MQAGTASRKIAGGRVGEWGLVSFVWYKGYRPPPSRILNLLADDVILCVVSSYPVIQGAQGPGEGSDRREVGKAEEPVSAKRLGAVQVRNTRDRLYARRLNTCCETTGKEKECYCWQGMCSLDAR